MWLNISLYTPFPGNHNMAARAAETAMPMDADVAKPKSKVLHLRITPSALAADQLWLAKLISGTDLRTNSRSSQKVDPPPQPRTSPKTRRRSLPKRSPRHGFPFATDVGGSSVKHASSSFLDGKARGKALADWLLQPRDMAEYVQSLGEVLGCAIPRPKNETDRTARPMMEDAIRILKCCGERPHQTNSLRPAPWRLAWLLPAQISCSKGTPAHSLMA